MQQSRLEELARQSPQLNDGVRRMLTVEFFTDLAQYWLKENYEEPDTVGHGIKRESYECVGSQMIGPAVESLDFGILLANKSSPVLKSVLIGPTSDTDNVYGDPFSLHYIDGSLVDAIFRAHSKKLYAGIRVIPPKPNKPIRIQIVRDIGHNINEEELIEECVTDDSQGKTVTLPYSWDYRGSTIQVEESGGFFHVTVTEPGFVRSRQVSFPLSLDARCNAFFELGNTDWRYAPQLFRISSEGGF